MRGVSPAAIDWASALPDSADEKKLAGEEEEEAIPVTCPLRSTRLASIMPSARRNIDRVSPSTHVSNDNNNDNEHENDHVDTTEEKRKDTSL